MWRKKNVFFYCILFVKMISFAQLEDNSAHIYLKTSIGIWQGATYINPALTGEWRLNRRIGLNYNLDLSLRSDSLRHFHFPMGPIASGTLISLGALLAVGNSNNNTDSGDTSKSSIGLGSLTIIGGILAFLLPDGISYHFPIRYKWDLAPYANVLGVDYIKNRQTGEKFLKYAASLGVKGTRVINQRFTFSVFAETRTAANFGWGFGTGAAIGYTFGKQDKKNNE